MYQPCVLASVIALTAMRPMSHHASGREEMSMLVIVFFPILDTIVGFQDRVEFQEPVEDPHCG
jgi:hypothetical protein